ncbi:IS30 family transposase [Rhodoferax lacus]|uniref:IS30 family transposase n=1 Tax=Rhodoferax lacus TaxID=2184758 RepID=UPI003B82CF38
MVGKKNSAIATVVDRISGFAILCKLVDRKSDSVIESLTKQMRQMPSDLYKSLTWDRGMELASHEQFSANTNKAVCFCDPGCPWQRGTNENTNGLLRQYFPKRTSLDGYTQIQLNQLAEIINSRPRKILGYRTPVEVLAPLLR